MRVAGIAAPGTDLESTCFLRQGRFPCAGSESTAGMQISCPLLRVLQSKLSGCACPGH